MKFIACLLMLSSVAFGQATQRTKVKFNCTCDDAVAARYATAFRDLLAASPRFVETSLASEPTREGSKAKTYHWVISVLSIDTDNPERGIEIALSVIVTLDDSVFSHTIQTCGSAAASNCAARTLSEFDKTIHSFQ